jgi:hypothetical protein
MESDQIGLNCTDPGYFRNGETDTFPVCPTWFNTNKEAKEAAQTMGFDVVERLCDTRRQKATMINSETILGNFDGHHGATIKDHIKWLESELTPPYAEVCNSEEGRYVVSCYLQLCKLVVSQQD